ncbi:hypothetical protein E2C01_034765 [Portunus trituberculatus]|uniref:Uncharacterized protein n=1 Tax=Portunus trituberculatus TaxID=210409 RepID=A0A5B7F1F0_PORTR|nr:hypothetical protein [Portunus trituberculatus]
MEMKMVKLEPWKGDAASLFHPNDTTAISSSISHDEFFVLTLADDSTLDDSELVSPSPRPSDYFILFPPNTISTSLYIRDGQVSTASPV